MKKNSKGFTLVELLAAIVILGILLFAAAPTILNMVETNRNKMYVDAAKKLISKAEYELRASSSKIEKPDTGDVIAISLVYLDSSDFDNAPGNGEYVKEASFVVVKNTGTGLEYAATIVEKLKKGGYKGVELTSNANLLGNNATNHVKVFAEKDLVFIEKNKIGSTLTKAYINKKLGNNYCNSVAGIYNYPGLSDDTSSDDVSDDSVTVIKKLSIESASDKSYNSFDAVLSVEVGGNKEARKNVKVHTSLVDFTTASNTAGESYGVADVYTKNFDFSTIHNKYEGQTIVVYVIVKDENGNSSRKSISYELHTNEAPIIDLESSTLTKRTSDNHNAPKALLKLDVKDDVDETANLDVCMTTVKGGSCSNYKKYSTYFGTGNTMEYDFGGIPDGRGMNLTVYVRDSYGKLTHADFDYQIYENQAPTISNVTITSTKDNFTSTGHLKAVLKLDATDDFGVDKLNVRVSSDGVDDIELKYSQINAGYTYTFAGNYDGSEREVTFYVTDEYGKTSIETKTYQVYKNKAPEFVTATLTSQGTACSNSALCPVSSGGSTETFATIAVKDDIDYANNYDNLKVCVSEDRAECADSHSAGFKNYSEFRGQKYPFVITPSDEANPYNGETKKVYFSVMDTYGEITLKEIDYKLYQNMAPSNISARIQSTKDPDIDEKEFEKFLPINLRTATLTISAEDDWGTDNVSVDICKKTGDNEEECEGFREYATSYDIEFDEDTYTGQQYSIIVKLKDEFGAIGTKTVAYTLYNDKAPIIDNFSISSKESAYNSKEVLVSYKVKDAMDNYSVCIGGSSSYEECEQNSYYISGENEFSNLTQETDMEAFLPLDYDNVDNDIYLVVKDSHGHEVSKKSDYKLYKYCTLIDNGYTTVRYYLKTIEDGGETGDGTIEGGTTEGETPEEPIVRDYIAAETCNSKCYRDGATPLEVEYNRFVDMRDLHFEGYDCSSPVETVTKDCSFHMCYEKGENEYYTAVGTKEESGNWTHEVTITAEDGTETTEEHVHSTYYKIYTVSYDEKTDQIRFTETAEKACPDLFDTNYYTAINGYVLTKD